uniref:Uncharacterized protein n=1 Tax=Meloidogyne enterolobii TaxID=390850 RepID=A0A6V7VNV9_MELEN|nr:unnamed protein product [Meloidogyne enterolobii]
MHFCRFGIILIFGESLNKEFQIFFRIPNRKGTFYLDKIFGASSKITQSKAQKFCPIFSTTCVRFPPIPERVIPEGSPKIYLV